jgi:hypothetical protein
VLKRTPAAIGSIKMLDDRAVVLDLRHPAWVQQTYPPTHARHASLLEHVGGLRPGEEKLVPPWPDGVDEDKVEASLRAYLTARGLSPDAFTAEVTGVGADDMAISAWRDDRSLSIRMRKDSYEIVDATERPRGSRR